MWKETNYKEDSSDLSIPNITHKIKPAEIESIEDNSIAQEVGFEPGDSIISINGKKPRDLIDYQILISEEILNISVLDKQNAIHNICIEKDQDVNLGINFKDALFDSIKQCNNKCPFCFIDQQPSGKRKSLYVKDDDYRLSFLYGSYLTLTNLKKEDWERIATQKLSPLFISVHATDPNTREKLLKNKKAGVILEQISWFEKNSIQIHAQIVVCPDINDGEILEKSIFELAEFYKLNSQTVLSVAIVPVGLTKFRPENDGLKSISSEYAKKTIKQIEKIQSLLQNSHGTRFCWLSDEWYLIAGTNLPSYKTYENMPQESNGIGSIRSFLRTLSEKTKNLPKKVKKQKKVSWIVGKLVYEALIPTVQKLNSIDGLTINLYGLPSIYWGQEQVVTGLLTGEDLIKGLQNKDLGEAVYIPSIMLKLNTDLFLDDKNIKEVENELNTQIHVLDDSNDIINTLIGKLNTKQSVKMLRKVINPILFLPIALCISSPNVLSSEPKNYIDQVLEEKSNKIFISYQDIEKIILNNNELKSLQNLVTSASFNLASKIAQRYPSIDFQAIGLPKYVSGKNYNSNLQTLKTSQFTANPSITIKWDLIDPLRGPEINIAKENYKIAENNYEIKKKDLVQEAKMRYHKYQKSYEDIQNKKFALDLSITSLENAKAKLDAGIGTKFEVLEAESQLSRDKQSLNEKKIEHEINKISLKEILNIEGDFEINNEQSLIGFWNHSLNTNINEGLNKSLSLKNLLIQKSIKKNQANSFLSQNKPNIYISNTFSSTFSKGDSLSTIIDSQESGSIYSNTISLNFKWNIFNGGQNNNSYKAKIADVESEEYAFKNLQNILSTKISKAYLNLKLNEEKIISSRKEIESSSESVRLSRLRYDVGISTLKDVLIRQNELSNAKSKNINAIYNYNLNLDELERLTFLDISKSCSNNNKAKDGESICNIPR